MPDDALKAPAAGPSEWVWILTCRQCTRVVDFSDVHEPFLYLTRWARCCGRVMELESVLRSRVETAEAAREKRVHARPKFASTRIEKPGRYVVTIDCDNDPCYKCNMELADDLTSDERRELIAWFEGDALATDTQTRRAVEDA
jgi:hypothetical protein